MSSLSLLLLLLLPVALREERILLLEVVRNSPKYAVYLFPIFAISVSPIKEHCWYCDESVSRGRKTGTKGRETGTKGRRTGTIGTKERGNEKPYGLVQIEYLDRGTSPRHVWTWRG